MILTLPPFWGCTGCPWPWNDSPLGPSPPPLPQLRSFISCLERKSKTFVRDDALIIPLPQCKGPKISLRFHTPISEHALAPLTIASYQDLAKDGRL